jgi:acetolactate synthase-1/2/3 large subunit
VLSSIERSVSPASAALVAQPGTLATALVDALVRLGVRHAFGVMGGAVAPLFRALAHSEIACLHTRHEAGAAFAAIEASLVEGRPTVVFTTAGPGLSNALTGMMAARWEGAQVIFLSAATSAAQRGRVATQETSAATFGPSMHLSGAPLHLAATLDHPAQLAPLVAQLSSGLARGSFVAHLAVPIDMQSAACPRLGIVARTHVVPSCPPGIAAEHAAWLAARPPVVWLGFGARRASAAIRALVERTGARVMCTPRAKGIVPEHHPRFLGVTGVGGHARVDEALLADRPDHTLVLGTRMGESSSFWAPELTPAHAFIHVDSDPSAFGLAYPEVPTHAVVADVGAYVEALLDALPARSDAPRTLVPVAASAKPALVLREHGPVRPQVLIEQVQRLVVEASDAWIMAESGNAFCWATHHLRMAEPGRYRVSTGFGSMGHAATGVLGAALARGGKAVALVGDGAMLMLNELHAAVQHRADALWIVLNDACYLMCAQGMQMMGWTPFSCELPPVDFAALARALGAEGERVTSELELGPALARAMQAKGPRVLDVVIDRRELPPSGRRNRSLMQQGFADEGRTP